MSCSVAGGSADGGGVNAGMPARAAGGGSPGSVRPPPNMIMTGTGVLTSAGVTSVIWMSTVIPGNAELSTWPTSCLPITGRPPTVDSTVRVTDHVTLGTFFGTRPSTSRSKSSTISARRLDHIAAVVTLRPSFIVRISG